MKKKKYEKPVVEVVELKQQMQLLTGSGGTTPYDPQDPTTW